MTLLVHATIRVTGPREQRQAFQARVLSLAAQDPFEGEVEERHSESELLYDLKVSGGIPFPPFVAASAENPALEIRADWVDPGAGIGGHALIRGGVLEEQGVTRDAPPAVSGVYAEVEPSGRLILAMTCREHAPGSFAGYAASWDRDAMFLLTRVSGERAGELLATVGSSPEWREHWLLDFAAGVCEHGAIEPPAAIPEALRVELERSARVLLDEWVWLASAPTGEIIIEQQRFQERGREIHPVNLRSARLKELEDQPSSGPRIVDALPSGLDWLKEVMRECWAETGRQD